MHRTRKDYLSNPGALKIDLMLNGIRIEDSLIKAGVCGKEGIDIILPEDTLANIPCREAFVRSSPYALKRKGGGFVITDGHGEAKARLVKEPAFLGRKTSSGVLFSRFSAVHGRYTVITPSPRCDFFSSNVECRYCAGNLDRTGEDSGVYSVDDCLEAVEAALKERASEVIYLSIGFSNGPDGGVEFLAPYIKAIKANFNCLLAIEALPPVENRWIDETYAIGADAVLYNIEIFDKELFESICPGRARLIGRKRYLDALKYAATIFPRGSVASHLIVGLEPPGSTCQGIDYLCSIGVLPILPIYRPGRGSALRIEPLTTEIIVPVYKHLYRELKRHRFNLNLVRDLSMVTTPLEARSLVEEKGERRGLVEGFYKSRLGLKAVWGLSTIRRKLRVKRSKDTDGH
jgi:hypothetical protein